MSRIEPLELLNRTRVTGRPSFQITCNATPMSDSEWERAPVALLGTVEPIELRSTDAVRANSRFSTVSGTGSFMKPGLSNR